MKMTINQRYFLGAAAVILATLAGILVAYPQLPVAVPIHWNIHGQVNGWAPKWALFLYGPGMMLALVGLFAALPWLSPKRFEVDSFRPTYLYIMIVTLAMFAYIQILTLLAALGLALDVGPAIEGGVCLLIALLGNVLGKVRRNFYVGVRTPWTIANERVWNATHRLAAKTFFAAGLLGFTAVLVRAPFWLPLTAILIGAFIPVIYSLIFYKQLEHRGELNGSP
ncbi:MAG: SdpI family protein [Candidatus Sulfotelmatobacter sp.]